MILVLVATTGDLASANAEDAVGIGRVARFPGHGDRELHRRRPHGPVPQRRCRDHQARPRCTPSIPHVTLDSFNQPFTTTTTCTSSPGGECTRLHGGASDDAALGLQGRGQALEGVAHPRVNPSQGKRATASWGHRQRAKCAQRLCCARNILRERRKNERAPRKHKLEFQIKSKRDQTNLVDCKPFSSVESHIAMEEPSSTTTTPSSSSVSPTADPNSTPNEHEGGTSTSPAVVVTSLKSLPKRKGTSDSGKKKSPKEKSGGTKGKKNGRLPSPRAGRSTEGGDHKDKDKEKEKDEASDNEKEEVKERRSLEYSRPNSSRVEGATGPAEGQLAPPVTKHQRKKSWDHGSPVDKAKHQHEGPMKLERRNSRNFEALVLAGEGSPRTSIRMRASAGKSGLSSPSRISENHYFVLRSTSNLILLA